MNLFLYGVITYKGKETLFELDEDHYYIVLTMLYIILYCCIIILVLNNYKLIITGNSFSSNYIEYESNDALFVKEYLNHT